MDPLPIPFDYDSFVARFPEFGNAEKHPIDTVQNAGYRASMHVTRSVPGIPMSGPYREYALFLVAAHILALADLAGEDSNGVGDTPAGIPFKATVGSVTIENTKPNGFTSDDFNYWYSQTPYGREYLAFIDTFAQGIYLNEPNDSVRDLL